MEGIFSLIGSLASIGGIPLAIYLFLKSKEAKFDKIKRDIVKILSYQIGEDREISPFEIQAVINSKLRENRIKLDSISVDEIIEDLVSETISSPMLDTERKQSILKNLKKIHFKSELNDRINNITISLKGDNNVVKVEEVEEEIKEFIKNSANINEREEELRESGMKQIRISNLFAIITVLVGFFTFILNTLNFLGVDTFFDNLKISKELESILVSLGVTFMAATISFLLKYLLDLKRKRKQNQ